jgi:hypothetical protein
LTVAGVIAANRHLDVFVATDRPGVLAMYDRSGRLVRTFGRRGGGPGEFEQISGIKVGPGDSLWVYDRSLSRMTLLDPTASRFVRSFPIRIPSLAPWVPIPDGRVVFTGEFAATTPDGFGRPFHIYNPVTRLLRSFGEGDKNYTRGAARPADRLIPALAPERVWLARQRRYEVELWDTGGKRHLILARPAQWFRPWDGNEIDWRVDRPQPQVVSVGSDSAGWLWVQIQRASPNWRPVPGVRRYSAMAGPPAGHPRPFAFTIDVIDPATRRLVFSSEVDQPGALLGAQLIAKPVMTEMGIIYYDVFRFVLEQPRRQEESGTPDH